jgi:hypothetical protein
MVNFPQAVALGLIALAHLLPHRPMRLALLALHPALAFGLRGDWEMVGDLAWVGVHAVWVPLWVVGAMM